jgi:hypothetical protein
MARAKAKKRAAKKQVRKARRAPRKRAAAPAGPKPVKTGKGATPLEVAQAVAGLARQNRLHEVEDAWLAPGIVSVEGMGASMAWSGKKNVLAKYRTWEANNEITAIDIEGPWVGATGFTLKYKIEIAQKATGQRTRMEEIAVYTVQNGKIVREEFHFPVAG